MKAKQHWIATLESLSDEAAQTNAINDLSSYIKQTIENPTSVDNKTDLGLWNFATIPIDKQISAGSWERTSLNKAFTGTLILVLDYDDGVITPQNFVERFGAFEFHLHTSFSHTPEVPKFRVIMPLEAPLSVEQLSVIRKTDLAEKLFGPVDKTCFEASRYFFKPGVSCRNPNDYFTHSNSGIHFTLSPADRFELEFETIKIQRDADRRGGKSSSVKLHGDRYKEAALKNIEAKIDQAGINRRGFGRGINRQIFGFFMQLVNVLGSEGDAKGVLLNHASDPTTIRDIKGCRTRGGIPTNFRL